MVAKWQDWAATWYSSLAVARQQLFANVYSPAHNFQVPGYFSRRMILSIRYTRYNTTFYRHYADKNRMLPGEQEPQWPFVNILAYFYHSLLLLSHSRETWYNNTSTALNGFLVSRIAVFQRSVVKARTKTPIAKHYSFIFWARTRSNNVYIV